jgi:hypothetical protein
VTTRLEPSTRVLSALFSGLVSALVAGACSTGPPPRNGSCAVAPDACASPDGGVVAAEHLTGYSCNGSARPDDDPTYIDGVPRGVVCSDRGAAGDEKLYCCTSSTTTCAYNPVADCGKGTYGYQCRGAERPDALNATIVCGQGLREDDLVDYCCSGTRPKPPCQQYDAAGCPAGLDGWLCTEDVLPSEEQLGPNESRADYTYALCAVAQPAPNPAVHYHCCYTPKGVPIGASCVQHPKVPGCEPGNFGFACYGPDRPEDDYPPMRCDKPGVRGRSAEGYPATLYCCTFQQP